MNVAIYSRKSTEQRNVDAEAKSVTRQIDHSRDFAKNKGWTVLDDHIYSDDAVSGAETKRLVNRQRLLDLIASGRAPFDVLVMRDQSRFSRRDGDEVLAELKRITQAGVQVYFYEDGSHFSFGTFSDNVLGFVKAEMNAEYRRQIASSRKSRICAGSGWGTSSAVRCSATRIIVLRGTSSDESTPCKRRSCVASSRCARRATATRASRSC